MAHPLRRIHPPAPPTANRQPPPITRFKRYLSNLEHFINQEGKRGDLTFEWTSP
jgi:hypothetical protein